RVGMKDGENEYGNVQSPTSVSNVAAQNEFDFINQLRQRAALHALSSQTVQSLKLGIGDDAAVIHSSAIKDTLVATDLLIEGIDFRRHTTPPYLLGHTALAVSLSDIAGMGARPRWSLISLGVPENVWQSTFANDFYEGLFKLAGEYDVQLIGGDTSRTPEQIVIDSIVVGDCAIDGAIKRSGAQRGDHIFVTGSIGGAAGGLRLIE